MNFEKVLIISDVFKDKYQMGYLELIRKDHHDTEFMRIKRRFIWFVWTYTNLYEYEIFKLLESDSKYSNPHWSRTILNYLDVYGVERLTQAGTREHEEIKSIVEKLIIYPIT